MSERKISKVSVFVFVIGVISVIISIVLIQMNLTTVEHNIYCTILQTQDAKNSKITLEEAKSIAFEKGQKKYHIRVNDYNNINAYYRVDGTWAIEFLTNETELDGAVTLIVDENKRDVIEVWNSTAQFHEIQIGD